jgi:phospholipid/cholesterol/gamma-HCH transport system ATP-binding protein
MAELGAPLAVEISDLVVGFDEITVLDHLSLEIRGGEILGLVGASGAGKSVLLRTMLGLSAKTRGRIVIFGMDQDKATALELQKLERRCGVLYQQGALFSSLTVFQNIEFPIREYLDLPRRLMREVATAKLEMVGLKAEDGEKTPSELSGGMTKRVALARALALDPAIVFLDEPTSGLDPIAAREFGVLIRTLQRTLGLTVFMVTHDLQALKTICDRIAALAEGKIVAIGSMSQVLESADPWVKSYFRDVRSEPPRAPATP